MAKQQKREFGFDVGEKEGPVEPNKTRIPKGKLNRRTEQEFPPNGRYSSKPRPIDIGFDGETLVKHVETNDSRALLMEELQQRISYKNFAAEQRINVELKKGQQQGSKSPSVPANKMSHGFTLQETDFPKLPAIHTRKNVDLRKVQQQSFRTPIAPASKETVTDVPSAFKRFAAQQRENVDLLRTQRAANNKEAKLADLKSFHETFKLPTPIPKDLLEVITKDRERQQRILAQSQLEASQAKPMSLPTKPMPVPMPPAEPLNYREHPQDPDTGLRRRVLRDDPAIVSVGAIVQGASAAGKNKSETLANEKSALPKPYARSSFERNTVPTYASAGENYRNIEDEIKASENNLNKEFEHQIREIVEAKAERKEVMMEKFFEAERETKRRVAEAEGWIRPNTDTKMKDTKEDGKDSLTTQSTLASNQPLSADFEGELNTVAQVEAQIATQKNIMREARERAIKRHQEEEASERAARKERIRPNTDTKMKDTKEDGKNSLTTQSTLASNQPLSADFEGELNTVAQVEAQIATQKNIMREARERAIKRHQEEEASERAARKERIRLKLEAMVPAPERGNEKETPKENIWRSQREEHVQAANTQPSPSIPQSSHGPDLSIAKNAASGPTSKELSAPELDQNSPGSRIAKNNHVGAFAGSVQAPDSSMGTLNYTYGSSIKLSTAPTSVSFDKPSMGSAPKGIMVQAQIVEESEAVPAIEQTADCVEEPPCCDTLSTISTDSVSVLNTSQKQDIIKRFTEAVLKNMPSTCIIPDGPDSSGVPFRQRFEPLLKNYSKKVQNDTHRKSQKQAAKQIRKLRYDISGRCEEAFKGVESMVKDHRIYPSIIKEAEKVHPPEKTWEEKVNDWAPEEFLQSEALLSAFEAPPSMRFSAIPGCHVQKYTLSDGVPDGHSASHRLSLSEFDGDTITSDGIDAEIIHIDAAEDREIYQYLTTHGAFQNLVSEAQRLIERYYSDQMELIRHRVLLGIRRPLNFGTHSSDRRRAMFHVDWDILEFLSDKYASGITQDLGCILAITGQAKNAHLSTVRSYLELTWPENSLSLLEAIQNAIAEYAQAATQIPPLATLSRDQGSKVSVNLETQTITVNGAEDFIVAIAQQLAWLVSACRASPTAELAYSYVSFQEDEPLPYTHVPTFRVASEVLHLSPEELTPGRCWNEVVGNIAIAAGFPIPERFHDEVGLEIPLEIMAGLGGVPIATQYDGGYLLKGRSVMFVPVERRADSVLWHFIRKDHGRIHYRDVANLCKKNRLLIEKLNEIDLLSTRAFLGWCKSSVNNLATPSINYENVGYSKANKPSKKLVNITGGSVGFSYFATGTATFSFGKHNGPYTAERSNFYKDLLDDARQIHVILQDMEQRRAWQTNAERAILHIILHRHAMGAYKIDGSAVKLQTADPGDPFSAREAMLQNATRIIAHDQCMKESMVGTKLFKDVAGELYSIFEGLEAKSDETSMEGIRLGLDWRRRTQGYDYMELVQRKHRVQLKEAELRKTCGNWPDYARDISAVVLFGTNFGEVFQPANTTRLCQAMRTAPKQKDYLIVEVSTLSDLYTEHGSLQDQSQITATGTRWHRSQHLFESCQRHKSRSKENCKCERIQQFVPKEYFGSVRLPGTIGNSGAVIFGQGTAHWISGIAKSLSRILEIEQEEDSLNANLPAPLTPRRQHSATDSINSREWDVKVEEPHHSLASHRIDAIPKDGASKPAITESRDETPFSRPRLQSSSRRRPHYSSFYRNDSNSISTEKAIADTDSDYLTPSTSIYTDSSRGQAMYISLAVNKGPQPNAVCHACLRNGKKPQSTPESNISSSHNQNKTTPFLYSDMVKTQTTGSARLVGGTQPAPSYLTVPSSGTATIPTTFESKPDLVPEAWKDNARQRANSYLQRDPNFLEALVPSSRSQPILGKQQYPGLRRKPNFSSFE